MSHIGTPAVRSSDSWVIGWRIGCGNGNGADARGAGAILRAGGADGELPAGASGPHFPRDFNLCFGSGNIQSDSGLSFGRGKSRPKRSLNPDTG